MIDLMGKKYYFFAFSIILIIAGVVGYLVNGLNLDIQFQGGTIVEMKLNEKIKTEAEQVEIQKKSEEVAQKAVGVKVTSQISSSISGNDADILVLSVPSKDTLPEEKIKLLTAAVADELKLKDRELFRKESVEPFIGKEIRDNGIKAVTWASILIILYIWWRFKVMSGLSAGIMAVIALLHDAAIMLAVYLVFHITLNESFIAAVLTILGYSMNDTIIIYDRIRENSNLLRKVPIAELVNKSILQTLGRSINTVVTVLICVITVYGFAFYNNIESIKEFTFPLIVGIASGCYSSIFIASPLWVIWKEHQSKKRVVSKTVKA